MALDIRRLFEYVVETHELNGQTISPAHRVAVAGVIVANPYGAGYVADLVTLADQVSGPLGELLGPRCVVLLGGLVEAFGKAALVGMGGEVEHGSALIHNLRFGNPFREAAHGTELLPSVEKLGLPGAPIDIPLKHCGDARTRSHHQTVTIAVTDAPREDEILVALVAANMGRPLARLAGFGSEVTASQSGPVSADGR